MQPALQTRLVECSTSEEALEGADLVTLATKSPRPVLGIRQLRPGVHVNSVGSARPNLSEIEPTAFRAFDRVECDSVDLVFTESGDAIAAVAAGLIDPAEAVDLSSALTSGFGREPSDVTLFKSTGTGLQDLALATAVLEMAEADDAGTKVDPFLAIKRFGPTGRT